MKVGTPKEIKKDEYRVGMTPAGVELLREAGHTVYVEKNAGQGTGIPDSDYKKAGAEILPTAKDVFEKSEMIIKVKEPLAPEFKLLREGHVLYTYLHLAGDIELTKKLLEIKIVGIAYETMEEEDGTLPLLVPMSEVAGRLAIHEGAKYIERPFGGAGILLGGVPGVLPAKVVILGGGVVGRNAAQVAAGIGADVIIVTRNAKTLRDHDLNIHGRVKTLKSNPWNIREVIKDADIVIGAILVTGATAPWLITNDMLKLMKKGSVLVDVSIDQGGCFETSKPTYHTDPVYEVDGIIHYCVANMPGCVPRTSTYALTNQTMTYAVKLANHGWKEACSQDRVLKTGLNVCNGKLTCKAVADSFNLPYIPPEEILR